MNTDVNINVGDRSDYKSTRSGIYDKIRETLVWKVVRSFLLISFFVYFLICLMFLFYQEKLIFSPTMEINRVPIKEKHTFTNLIIRTGEIGSIHGWYITSPENLGTVFYCRDSNGNISDDIKRYEMWNSAGYNVLTFDYRGYGLSYGEVSEENFYTSAECAYRLLQSKGLGMGPKFIIHGRAAGAAVAAKLASEHPCSGLVLESAFTSMKDLCNDKLPYLPTAIMLRTDFPTQKYLADTDVPLLVMHSPEDEVIPWSMGRKLFNTGNSSKKFFSLSGGHQNGYMMTDGYRNALKDFADGIDP